MKPSIRIKYSHPLYPVLASVMAIAPVALAAAPPDPATAGEVVLPQGNVEYVLTEDLVYDQEIYFNGMFYVYPDLSLTFKGQDGDEMLTFDHAVNSKWYFMVAPGGPAELVFDHLDSVNLLNMAADQETIYVSSAGADASSSLTFRNISGDVNISGNYGDARYVSATITLSSVSGLSTTIESLLTFDNIGGNVTFNGNRSVNGVLFLSANANNEAVTTGSTAELAFTNIGGAVSFTNNEGGSAMFIENYYDDSSHMQQKQGHILFRNVEGGVTFADNSARYGGCAYLMQNGGENSIVFDQIRGGINILRNESTYSHCGGFYMASYGSGLFSITNVDGDVVFEGNSAKELGGAVLASHFNGNTLTISDVKGDVVFRGNSAEKGAGAIYLDCEDGDVNVSIAGIDGNVLFENNKGGTIDEDRVYGGAIYASSTNSKVNVLLSADGGDITFTGNTHEQGMANAMAFEGSTDIQLRAREGRSVHFYDPIAIYHLDQSADTNVMEINKDAGGGVEYSGRVVFSGRHLAQDAAAAAYVSTVVGDIKLHNGTLVLEHGATLGRKQDPADVVAGSTREFNMLGGVLDISGNAARGNSVLTADSVLFAAGTDATIRAGESAVIDAGLIDMGSGITVDLAYYFSGQDVIDHGLKLIAETLVMGGHIVLADDNASFYQDAAWAGNRDFVLFDISEAAAQSGNFGSVLSALSGSSRVDDPLLYQGEWLLAVEDNQVIARWISSFSPIPEPASGLLGLLGFGAMVLRRRKTS